ncbi:MAG: hypothetical protein ABIH39_04750 [Candidatus Margulisiibacteriota bacterium]
MNLFKKILIQGLPVGFLLLFLASITGIAGVSNFIGQFMKNITGWMISIGAYNLIAGILFTFVYSQVQGGLSGSNPINKGLTFGFFVWLAGNLPSLIHSFILNPSLCSLVQMKLIVTFISYPLAGAFLAFIDTRYLRGK